MRLERKMGNGSWTDCDTRDGEFLARAAAMAQTTIDEIVAALAGGQTVRYDTEWSDYLRDADAIAPVRHAPVDIVRCSCGHTVSRVSVMTTSSGSSCPSCYDRMSY